MSFMKHLYVIIALSLGLTAFGQTLTFEQSRTLSTSAELHSSKYSKEQLLRKLEASNSSQRLLTCGIDTILYPLIKSDFRASGFFLNQSSEAFYGIGQRYDGSGPVTIHGASFYAFVDDTTGGNTVVDVIFSVYNRGFTGAPIGTPLASDTVQVDTTGRGGSSLDDFIQFAVLDTPITVTNDYILVLENGTNTTNADLVVWRGGQGTGKTEFLSSFKVSSNNQWLTPLDLTAPRPDFDWMIFPFVTYDFDVDFTIAPPNNPACLPYDREISIVASSTGPDLQTYSILAAFAFANDEPTDSIYAWSFDGLTSIGDFGDTVTRTFSPPTTGDSLDVIVLLRSGYSFFCDDGQLRRFKGDFPPNSLFGFQFPIGTTDSLELIYQAPFPNDGYTWNFGSNATPATATGQGPHTVMYATNGEVEVSLIAERCSLSDTTTQMIRVGRTATSVLPGIVQRAAIFPNPSQGQVMVELEMGASRPVSVEVVDLRGRVLMRKDAGLMQNGTISLDLTDQVAGLYLVNVTVGEDHFVRRLMIE